MRNPEYEFLSLDSEELEQELTGRMEELTGETVRPASREKLLIRWLTLVLIQERARANREMNQNIPSRAEGENLDALAQVMSGVERPGAESARCRVRFTLTEGRTEKTVIPKGTRVTDGQQNLYWETTEEGQISPEESQWDTEVVCQSTGEGGNGWLPGQINVLVDAVEGCAGCENVTESTGGREQMEDDEFYDLLRMSMDSLSPAGPVGSYIYRAKAAADGVADVVVNSPKEGTVAVYALMEGGSVAGTEVKNTILAALNEDDVRPLTDYVVMKDPEQVEYSIDMTWYAPESGEEETGELAEKVEEAVAEYILWQSGKLGRDINPSKLIGLVMAAGARRVEVVQPVFTRLQDGRSAVVGTAPPKTPQIAVLKTKTVISGGTEED